MTASELVFLLLAVAAIASGAGVVLLRNPVHCAMSLVGNMITLAVLYLMLNAQFVAALQVIVYAGAVMVLFLFVLALLSPGPDPQGERIRGQRPLAALAGALVLALLLYVIYRAQLPAGTASGVSLGSANDSFGAVVPVGLALFQRFLLPFEATSLLLLIAAIGAIYLSRRTDR
ncbi:MAG: NADH-quinone oxidoreductase subunit J family protein [Candidatus Dormibacteria bacterium]